MESCRGRFDNGECVIVTVEGCGACEVCVNSCLGCSYSGVWQLWKCGVL